MAVIPFFDLSRQNKLLSARLDDAYRRVMEKSSFISGDEVRQFETSFASYLGVEHCVSCANGTDALELALEAGGIKPGHEVIVPANTWVSVAEAVVRLGAVPVFADTVEGEYALDPASVGRCLSGKTRAIIVVHQYGTPARIGELLDLAKNHQLLLIEDCAHAQGAMFHGRKVGSFGDFGCFSFYPTKNLGCLGDGGAVVTKFPEKARELRLLANHGQPARNVHRIVGRNSRLDELQAAFLNVKLPYLDQWNSRRKAIASHYTAELRANYSVPYVTKENSAVFHQYVIQCADRQGVIDQLKSSGIETTVHYPELISQMAPYRQYRTDPEGLSVGEIEKKRILSLPVFPELTDAEVERVVAFLQ